MELLFLFLNYFIKTNEYNNKAPSILALLDFGNLERDYKLVNISKADWFHLDIMDGVFVPNISYGMPVVNISEVSKKILDVHLMIVDPDRYIETFKILGGYFNGSL